MSTFDDMITDMPEKDLHQCIKDYEEFRQYGFIGDCVLRNYAEKYRASIHAASVTTVMYDIAFAAYRHFYIEAMGSTPFINWD